jgi:hypothetical protein
VDGDVVTAHLRTVARGIANGQALVVYDGTRVVGSATITRAARRGGDGHPLAPQAPAGDITGTHRSGR